MVAWLAVQAGVSASFLIGEYVYHRWFEDKPLNKIDPQEVGIPRVDDGAPVPIIYGRCRVRAPIMAWHGAPVRNTGTGLVFPGNYWPTDTPFYQMSMFLVLGAGMAGASTSKVYGMWIGDKAMPPFNAARETLRLVDIFPTPALTNGIEPGRVGGQVTWYDGYDGQNLQAGEAESLMIESGVSADAIPNYRGLISVLLHNEAGADSKWIIGGSPSTPAYSFEASSYAPSNYPWGLQVGMDCNPIDVLYDLLTAQLGRLGIASSWIHLDSWIAAAGTLAGESHGYSRCIEDRREANEVIQDILRQIDGVMYFDDATAKLKIKLVRADYDPATIPQITRSTAVDLTNLAAGGWSNLVNKVRVVYSNRDDGYRDASEVARNQANAAGQDGVTIEHVIEFRGVTHASLAYALAHRELAALSRPLMKCRAIVDRTFLRVNPGDAVNVTWTNPDLAGIIFRVASVDRGTLENGQIALDLIQSAEYSFRGRIAEPPAFVDTGFGGEFGGVGG